MPVARWVGGGCAEKNQGSAFFLARFGGELRLRENNNLHTMNKKQKHTDKVPVVSREKVEGLCTGVVKKIEEHRRALNWPYNEVARRGGVTRPGVSKVEKRGGKRVSLEMLLYITEALGCRLEELLRQVREKK